MPRKGQTGKKNRAQVQRAAPLRQILLTEKPPQLQTGTVVKQWYRFGNTGNVVSAPSAARHAISVASLLQSCGLMALATGTGVSCATIAQAARVMRIRAWAAAPVVTSAATTAGAFVSVDFDVQSSSITASGLQYMDQTVSNAQVANIDVRPPKGSFAAQWHNQGEGGSTLFFISGTVSCIFDVQVEWILNDADAALIVASTVAVTAGQMFYGPLDGIAVAHYTSIGRQNA